MTTVKNQKKKALKEKRPPKAKKPDPNLVDRIFKKPQFCEKCGVKLGVDFRFPYDVDDKKSAVKWCPKCFGGQDK